MAPVQSAPALANAAYIHEWGRAETGKRVNRGGAHLETRRDAHFLGAQAPRLLLVFGTLLVIGMKGLSQPHRCLPNRFSCQAPGVMGCGAGARVIFGVLFFELYRPSTELHTQFSVAEGERPPAVDPLAASLGTMLPATRLYLLVWHSHLRL